MPERRVSKPPGNGKPRLTATTPEGRESQMIAAAERLAAQQLADGTASAQVITHYLKLGSTREQLEQQRLEGELRLQEAKIKAMASTERLETLYTQAMESLRGYRGETVDDAE
ncbi:hypothetical protein SEA_LIBERTYBELL_1 [Streptomyces phage LibertyBell]|nr:hypothetical protein SEA_LIBERTYBELL_1 [Streptomyces phage LibertyBell]